jgi:choice-of-anchor B domain-containing protein
MPSLRAVRSCALALVLLAVASPVRSGPNTACPILPTDVNVMPGVPVNLGGTSVVVAGYVKRDALPGTGGGEDAAAARTLVLDVLARPVDPATGEPRRGGWVPGLPVSFRLGAADGTTLGSGTMAPGLTAAGPSYTASVPVAGDPGTMSLDVAVGALPDPGVEPDHGGGEHGDVCPGLPANLHLMFEMPAYGEEPWAGGDDDTDAPAIRTTLMSHLDPRPADDYSNVWGWNDGTTYLAVIGAYTGTVFVDVTDPTSPVEVGFVDGPDSQWREIKSYRNWIYVVTEGDGAGRGLQIVDVSDPQSPVLAGTYDATFHTAHTLFIDEVAGRAYINGTNTNGSASGMRILALEPSPTQPVEVGAWTSRYVHDSYVAGGIACLSEIYVGLQELFDVSNPASPQLLSSWTTPNAFTHNCWANDDFTLLVTTDEVNPGGHLGVYDVTVKTSPGVLRSEYRPNANATVHNAYFEDGDDARVAMSHYGVGMKLVDLHRPSAPLTLAAYDTYPGGETGFVGAWGMYNYDPRGYFYLSDIQTGLYVVRYDPTGGTLSGVVRDAATSEPIAGAKVVALADGSAASTGADGVYALYAPAGASSVRVSAFGYRSAVVPSGAVPLDGRVDLDVALEALPTVALSGTVRRSDTSAGVAGAAVRVAGTTLATTSAADGSYAFPEVAVGQQTVTAELFGFSPSEGRTVLAAEGPATLDLVLDPARFADDAETNRGWTIGSAPGDTAASGKWERVDPNGTGGGTVQPESDHTPAPGTVAFVTGQSVPGASTESNDVDGGTTSLVSPAIDASGLSAAKVGYHRWFSNNAGVFAGGTLTVQASANNGGTWITLETVSSNANAWTRREFDLGSVLPLTDQMRVRFQAASASFPSLSVLEAGVDDFEVVRACRSRFNPARPDADGDGEIDACDACALDGLDDADGDGVCGNVDNAPFVANPGQADADADGVGDAADLCPGTPDAFQRDQDADGEGDACDADLDGDGLANESDDDRDDDGVLDAGDLCPGTRDPRQLDRDSDGQGDLCDGDDGEVQGLRVSGAGLTWEPEAGSTAYNLYRGDLGAAALVRLAACRISAAPANHAADADLPAPGDGWFYLVSREVAGVEGTLGKASDGATRVVDSPCP